MADSFHDEEILGKAYDAHLMRRLLVYLRPYWRMTLFALLAILLFGILQAVPPYLLKVEVDRYLDPTTHAELPKFLASFLSPNPVVGIAQIALVLFLPAIILTFGLQFAQSFSMQLVGQQVMYDMRKQLFAHLQRLQMSFFDRNPVGRLVTRVTTDVDVLNDLFASGVVAIIGDVFSLISHCGGDAEDGLETRAPHLLGASHHRSGYRCFPKGGARILPAHSCGHCAHQCLLARTHHRDGGVTAF